VTPSHTEISIDANLTLRFARAAIPCSLLLALGSAPPNMPHDAGVAPRTRTYYIAADPVDWNYVPGGRDEVAGRPYVGSVFCANAKPRPVSTVYKKVLYREYTDATFHTLERRTSEWEHLGFGHGNTVIIAGMRTDVAALSMVTDAGDIIVTEGQYTVSIGGGQSGTTAPTVVGMFRVKGSKILPD
jgi:hypothetical protein